MSYAGISYPYYKTEVQKYLKELLSENSLALDVGAGAGIYSSLLRGHYIMEAIEIFEPAIINADLYNKYDKIYCEDIRNFIYTKNYDLIIFGDILEHMNVNEAQNVLNTAYNYSKYILIAVPYCYEQEEVFGNKYEKHIQDDITIENFNERYPNCTLIFGDSQYGYYIKKGKYN